MSAHPLEKVIELWGLEKLTQEQVLGQILLLLQEIHERLGDLERRQSESRRGDEGVKRA
jgi:hypothetical protein